MTAAATAPAPSRLLKLSDVRARTSLSPATIYRWLKADRFPQPIRYSDKCVRWREADIDTWINGKPSSEDVSAD